MVADDTPSPAAAEVTAAEPLAPMPLVGGVGPIVVGVDGSPCSVLALRWALEQGTRRHTAVHVVLAWSMPMVLGVALAVTSSEYDVRAHARAELDRILHAQADLMSGRPAASPVTSTLRQANPASALLAAADGASLLVVGSRGRGGFAGALLGSVSHQCVLHALCPVVVVRVPEDA